MKKTLLIITIAIFTFSCSSGKVCGGSGGKRCVDASIQPILENVS